MPKKGLSPKTFQGLNKKRMQKKGGNFKRLIFKQGESVVVQFLDPITDFLEYENHSWRDSSGWNYVPCAGDDCPLCADDDENVSKTSYRFCCNVWSFKEKKVMILEGPKDLAGRIAQRYKRATKNGKKPSKAFTTKVYEVSKFATQPVSYDVEVEEDQRPVTIDGLERHDLLQFLTDEMVRYFGDDIPSGAASGPSALDDDDDWDDDDDEFDDEDVYTKKDLLKMGPAELKLRAREAGVKVKKVTKQNREKVIQAILRKQ